MPTLDDYIRGVTSGEKVISPVEAAAFSTKKEERRAVRMTHVVSGIGLLVAMVAVSIALPGSIDAHIAIPAILFSGVIVYFLCFRFCNNSWVQPARMNSAEVERLKSELARANNPDEQKKLEDKLLRLSGNFALWAMSQPEYASKLGELEKREKSARTSEERQESGELKNQLEGGLLFRANSPIGISLLISIFAVFSLTAKVQPFRHFDSVVLVCLDSLLPACIFTFLMVRKYPLWPYMTGLPGDRDKSSAQLYLARAISTLALTLLLTWSVFWLNQSLDHAAANPQTLMILDKKFTIPTDRKTGATSENCFVYVPSPVLSPLSSANDDHQEQIQISPTDYDRVIPQQTKITIDVAKGFLHIPWYNGHYTIALSQ